MTTKNTYATLLEFRDYVTSRGGSITHDATDDVVIESLLKAASRYIDTGTGRSFVPFIEARTYDLPSIDSVEPRSLPVEDLLEVITITNGDDTSVASTEYTLRPSNTSPSNHIRLKDNSTTYWASDGAGDTHDVITVTGIWGMHDRYGSAWETLTTANEAMDASETAYTVTSVSGFVSGDIIRFDNEFGYVSSVGSDLNIIRGINGSTAATHLTSINVKVWRVMDECKLACLEIANNAYRRRFGQSATTNTETVTASGVVLSPRDIPATAQAFINTFRRYS